MYTMMEYCIAMVKLCDKLFYEYHHLNSTQNFCWPAADRSNLHCVATPKEEVLCALVAYLLPGSYLVLAKV